MGSWGDLPWESDASLDKFIEMSDDITDYAAAALRDVSGDMAMDSASNIDRVRLIADIIVRLEPYWDPQWLEKYAAAYSQAMGKSIEHLEAEYVDTSYDRKVQIRLSEIASRSSG